MEGGQTVVVGLGELLWDILPGGKQLGGAPANFAYYAAMLGNRGVIASRVGTDVLAREALDHLKKLGLPTTCIQVDSNTPTGTVLVQLDETGQPDYTITEDVAWDHLEWSLKWQELAETTDAVCFGSLAQRSHISRATIRRFLQSTARDALRVFDVNLRQSFYSTEVLSESLKLSQVVKLNEHELPQLAAILGLKGKGDEELARSLLQAYDLELVSLTRGDRGSLLVSDSEAVEHSGFQVVVADTVGAGDAFTAALTHHYLARATLESISEAANRLGSWVATQSGATPAI